MTFNEIYKNLHKELRRYAFSFTKNNDDAKDVTQDTFIKIYHNLHTLENTNKIRTWAYIICKNVAINFIKKKNVLPIPLSFLEVEGVQQPTTTQINNVDYLRVQRKIHELPTGYRSVFVLKNAGYTHNEISEILDISRSTSKTQYMRAKMKLIEKLNN